MSSMYLQNAGIILFSTVIITETVVRLRSVIDIQVQRLETINRVSQRISSTLDNAEVMEIVKASIQEALEADTYFLGILSGKETIRLELLYDDGVFFPAKDYPIRDGAGAWVLRNRRSLLFGEFEEALANVKPRVEVRSRRVGGANYQVPMSVNNKRQQSLAFRWIIDAIRSERGKPMHMRLAKELADAAHNEGKAVTTRENTQRMAEANRAFAHFAW